MVLYYLIPELDGEAVAREMRRSKPSIPIVFYCGALENVPDRVLVLGDEFVSKTEPISNLLYYVQKLAHDPQAQADAKQQLEEMVMKLTAGKGPGKVILSL